MRIGNFYFNYSPRLEFQFVSIEFNQEKIDECTKKLNEFIKKEWDIQTQFQTERGIVVQLARVVK